MRGALLRAVRFFVLLVRILAVLLLLGSVAVNFENVVSRYVFRSSNSWAEEVMLFLMVGCVFLGGGPVVWSGNPIRMDVLTRLLPVSVREKLALLSEVATLVTALVLVCFAWPTIHQLYDYDQRSAAADIPLVIPQGSILLGLAIIALLSACRIGSGSWRERVQDKSVHQVEGGAG